MKKRNSLLAFAAIALAAFLISFSSVRGKSPKKHTFPPTPGAWTGYNSQLSHYYVAPSYPSYEAHPRYLGELSGSWEEIGRKYGEKAGDLIRMVYEGWYRELLAVQGSPAAIMAYVHQEETYYEALVPEALELMKGMADGAKDDLDESAHAGVMTSMISLCQEGKSSPDALRRSACTNSFRFFAACVGLSAVVPLRLRTRHPFAVSAPQGLHRRLSL